MQVDLSEHEIRMLDDALLSWERDPERDGMMNGMMSSVLRRVAGVSEAESQENSNRLMREGSKASQDRRIKGTLLRAKLFQVLARASEHPAEPDITRG